MSAIAGAYASLTVPQLKTMLATARTAHRREMEDVKAKHAAELPPGRSGPRRCRRRRAITLYCDENCTPLATS